MRQKHSTQLCSDCYSSVQKSEKFLQNLTKKNSALIVSSIFLGMRGGQGHEHAAEHVPPFALLSASPRWALIPVHPLLGSW